MCENVTLLYENATGKETIFLMKTVPSAVEKPAQTSEEVWPGLGKPCALMVQWEAPVLLPNVSHSLGWYPHHVGTVVCLDGWLFGWGGN